MEQSTAATKILKPYSMNNFKNPTVPDSFRPPAPCGLNAGSRPSKSRGVQVHASVYTQRDALRKALARVQKAIDKSKLNRQACVDRKMESRSQGELAAEGIEENPGPRTEAVASTSYKPVLGFKAKLSVIRASERAASAPPQAGGTRKPAKKERELKQTSRAASVVRKATKRRCAETSLRKRWSSQARSLGTW